MNINRYALCKERSLQKIIKNQPKPNTTAIGVCSETQVTHHNITKRNDECLPISAFVPKHKEGDGKKFLNIASKLDSLAFDDDPYEYHDNEGVESISDIADNLLNPTYRKAIIKALQDKLEYYAEDEFDDANIAERAKDILDNLAEIFGSDEQED